MGEIAVRGVIIYCLKFERLKISLYSFLKRLL